MTGKHPAVLVLAVALAMAACSEQGSPEGSQAASRPAEPVAPAPAKPAWDTSAAPVAGTSVTLSPNPADLCTRSRTAVDVAWDVTAAGPATIQLWVVNGDGHKLWAALKESSGSKRTGDWMRAGMAVAVVDPRTKTLINSATLEASACP